MNRLPSTDTRADAALESGPASLLARSVREPSLLRLAQSIEELNPDLARALCLSGLAAMSDPVERDSWRARLAPWLEESDDADGDDGGALLAAA
jgi:hypothetical protein